MENNKLKEGMYDILDISSVYSGWYNPNTSQGNPKELAKLIDNIRDIAKRAILESQEI